MPKILAYTSEVSAPGPIRQVPGGSVDAINPAAHNLEKFGSAITGASELIDQRMTQDEVSDLAVKLSQKHVELKQELENQTQKGTLNTQDFTQKVQDSLQDVGENIQTKGGKNFFTRQSAVLSQHLLESSMASQAELAGAKAVSNYSTTLNNLSSGLVDDPSSFEASKKMHAETIDALVASGGLPAIKGEEFKRMGNTELAKSAIKGMVNLNPDAADAALKSGQWDEYLKGDVKDQMYGEVSQAKRAEVADQMRKLELQKKAQEALTEKWLTDALPKVLNNSLSTKDILNANVPEHVKEHMLSMTKEQASQAGSTDPSVYNDAFRRINLPYGDPQKITDQTQLFPMVGHGLQVKDVADLTTNWLEGAKSQEGQDVRSLKASFFAAAKSELVKKDEFGNEDPTGGRNYTDFIRLANQKIAEQRKANKPISDLFDKNSKDFMGPLITQLKKSPTEIINEKYGIGATDQVLPTATPSAAKAPLVRKANESPAAFLKRKKDAGE